ncbi:unnamed protein product [Gongylonema pulchrum]|uniref:Transposase n=1 Tax=Gongylonema pulchrum TaxID=637853 RepID=A0A183CXK4_9BILA|nr:unnamed protein product [Gongylonema pulchrum]
MEKFAPLRHHAIEEYCTNANSMKRNLRTTVQPKLQCTTW